MGEIFDRASSLLERRFLKNAFLPALLLPLAILAPYFLQQGRLEQLAGAWDAQSLAVKGMQLVGYFSIVWFLAAILASQWRNIIRLFEGYPLMRVPHLGEYCADWHRSRAEHLDIKRHLWALYYGYPEDPDDFLPTRLGNILRAAERYPYYRYRADTIVVWPRLYHLLPRQFVDDVEDARSTVEFLLVVSLWFAAFGLGSLTLITLTGGPLLLGVVCLQAGALGAYAAYLSALPAAEEYGEQLRAGVELHRLQLLESLRLPAPKNLEEERVTWERLLRFVGAGYDDDSQDYVEPGAPRLVVELPGLT